ncbi:hypothetical protein NECAME_03100 [Necator americanus]|uniref:Uncharacterized protein n=1 Tax=Necator americanus TaxID=51031 RepID=W2T9K9_NECAM|nr:hypothetical protein NECAME_03100 [Necator americanus]ETN77682.1 hypothetical protein NECAME_03100 [Necator americanus]
MSLSLGQKKKCLFTHSSGLSSADEVNGCCASDEGEQNNALHLEDSSDFRLKILGIPLESTFVEQLSGCMRGSYSPVRTT